MVPTFKPPPYKSPQTVALELVEIDETGTHVGIKASINGQLIPSETLTDLYQNYPPSMEGIEEILKQNFSDSKSLLFRLALLSWGQVFEAAGYKVQVIFPDSMGGTWPPTHQKESYRNPFYSGLLTPEHHRKIKEALWVFFWLIDKTTVEYTDEAGIRWGKVLGGKPITYREIANCLGVHWRTVKKDMDRLRSWKYVRVKRHPWGLIVEIRHSRKFLFKELQNDRKLSVQSDRILSVQSDRILPSEEQNTVTHFPANVDPPMVSPSYYKRHIKNTIVPSFSKGKKETDISGNGESVIEKDKPEARELCNLLLAEIRKNKPDFKDPRGEKAWESWTREMDRLIRLDKKTPERISEVIRWVQADNVPSDGGFCWAVNVLSPGKLRKQFDQLEMRMDSERKNKQGSNPLPPYLRD